MGPLLYPQKMVNYLSDIKKKHVSVCCFYIQILPKFIVPTQDVLITLLILMLITSVVSIHQYSPLRSPLSTLSSAFCSVSAGIGYSPKLGKQLSKWMDG